MKYLSNVALLWSFIMSLSVVFFVLAWFNPDTWYIYGVAGCLSMLIALIGIDLPVVVKKEDTDV